MSTVTLDKPIARGPVTGFKLSQVLVSVFAVNDRGAVVQQVSLSVEDRLSPAARSELEALAATQVKLSVATAEAPPPAPAPVEPLPG